MKTTTAAQRTCVFFGIELYTWRGGGGRGNHRIAGGNRACGGETVASKRNGEKNGEQNGEQNGERGEWVAGANLSVIRKKWGRILKMSLCHPKTKKEPDEGEGVRRRAESVTSVLHFPPPQPPFL